jgi:hypothetical protein
MFGASLYGGFAIPAFSWTNRVTLPYFGSRAKDAIPISKAGYLALE